MKSPTIFAALLFVAAALLGGPNHWTNSGPDVGAVNRIYTAPEDPNEAFAFTAAGIYRTNDGGRSWRPANEGLPNAPISNFVVATDRTLYLSIADTIFGSDDAGAHWCARGRPPNDNITALIYDPASKRLIAGSSAGIDLSDDGGQAWTKSELRGSDASSGIACIVMSETAAYATTTARTLLRSADAGTTWQPMNASVSELYTDPSTSWVYARSLDGMSLMVSKDEAKTWTALPSNFDSIFKVVATGESVYVLNNTGVFAWRDGVREREAVVSTRVNDFAISSSTRRRFYAASPRGVMTSVEGDGRWVPSNGGLPGANALDVDVANTDASTAYTATEGGVFRTDDGGNNWMAVNPNANANHVAVSPATADTAYVSFSTGSIQRTSDRGTTWTQVTPEFASVLAIAPSDPKTLYAAFKDGMAKSTDGGDAWSTIDVGLFLGYYPGDFEATSIAIDPSNASNVVMSTRDAVAKTTDGATWTQVTWDEWNVSAITLDPSDPSTLFGGNGRFDVMAGVIRSIDAGASWHPAGLSNKKVVTLVMRGATLYAGTGDGHIYRSGDRGDSWIGFDHGTSLGRVNRLAADSSGKHFLAATSTGVYRYDAPDQIITPVPITEDPLRVAETLDAIGASAQDNAALIVPIAGTARGFGGTVFTTELLLSNANPKAQSVRMTWLPQGGDGGISSFELTIPGASDPSGGTVGFLDLGGGVSRPGIGSLIVVAVDSSGNFDANASIDASTVVWSEFGDGRAPASQSIPAARANLLVAHNTARLSGLRCDAQFRTNVGIVNLSAQTHQFTIHISGERSDAQFTIEVPPLSVIQSPLPAEDYGPLTLNVVTDSHDARWMLYGSSIDRITGEAQTSLASSYD